jgi:predicted HTH transcriptional regulator
VADAEIIRRPTVALSTDQFIELLNGGIETRSVEFKAGGPRNDPVLFAFVARAVLAMTNLRLGGWVIAGVKADGTLIGLSEPDIDTWLEHDEVSDGLNAYADPFVQVASELIEYEGKRFIVIRVREFEEVPVLARKDSPTKYDGKLIVRRGGCYVRPRNQPASVEVPTQTEMRELIDAAVDKSLARFRWRAGLVAQPPGALAPSDDTRFEDELKGFR